MSRSDEIYKKIVIRLMRKLYKREYEGVEEIKTPDLIDSRNADEGLEITCIKNQNIFRTESHAKKNKFYANPGDFEEKAVSNDFVERAREGVERKLTKDYSRCSKVDLLLFDEGFTNGCYENELYETLKKENINNHFGVIYLFFYREGVYINDYNKGTHKFIKLDSKNRPVKSA